MDNRLEIKFATKNDIPLILKFINELAEYEKLSHEVVATEKILEETLFGQDPVAKVILGYHQSRPAGFALFFYNYSTFLGRPGIYLEDLYVRPEMRGKGFGKQMISYLAKIAKEKQCGRLQWIVLDWNQDGINFYQKIGAKAVDDWRIYRVDGEALDKLAKQ